MKQFLYFFIVVLIVSCTSNTIYKKPENLIPKDSMMNLLTDMYIASSAKSVKNKMQEKDVNYMVLVYEKYNIDSTRFYESNTYYTSRIEEYDEMLKEIKKMIESKNLVLQKQIKIEDSIKRIKDIKVLEKEIVKKKDSKKFQEE